MSAANKRAFISLDTMPPDGWALTTVAVRTAGSASGHGWVAGREPEPADATMEKARAFVSPSCPGLGLTEGRGSYVGYWRVTHLASGYAAGAPCGTLVAAAGLAAALSAAANWDVDRDAAIALANDPAIRNKVFAYGSGK